MTSLVAFLAATALGTDGNWSLVKMTSAVANGAVCLDGSPAAHYIREPMEPPAAGGDNTWVIFHEGGGWCNGVDNCFNRGLGDLGSSNGYPEQIGNTEAPALFNAFPQATIVYAKYCTGDSLTGDNATVSYAGGGNKSQPVYYRGKRVLDAMWEDLLDNRGLKEATQLLYTGCSAGALTAYTHADYATERMAGTPPSPVPR